MVCFQCMTSAGHLPDRPFSGSQYLPCHASLLEQGAAVILKPVPQQGHRGAVTWLRDCARPFDAACILHLKVLCAFAAETVVCVSTFIIPMSLLLRSQAGCGAVRPAATFSRRTVTCSAAVSRSVGVCGATVSCGYRATQPGPFDTLFASQLALRQLILMYINSISDSAVPGRCGSLQDAAGQRGAVQQA
jgi:hypothetical protein